MIQITVGSKTRSRRCHNQGHIERVYRVKKQYSNKAQGNRKAHKEKQKKVHKVTDEQGGDTDSEEGDLACLELHSVKEIDERKIIWITLEVAGARLKMELDTGSALSVISEDEYKKLFSDIPLKTMSVLLKTYTGQKVSPKGKMRVAVK